MYLLSICNLREGIWESWLTSRVATRIVEIEEDGAREHLHTLTNGDANGGDESIKITNMLQIPEQVRLVHLVTIFSPERHSPIHEEQCWKQGNRHI